MKAQRSQFLCLPENSARIHAKYCIQTSVDWAPSWSAETLGPAERREKGVSREMITLVERVTNTNLDPCLSRNRTSTLESFLHIEWWDYSNQMTWFLTKKARRFAAFLIIGNQCFPEWIECSLRATSLVRLWWLDDQCERCVNEKRTLSEWVSGDRMESMQENVEWGARE